MQVATGHDVVVVGAGILGLASAYHILQADRGLDLLVLDRLPGAGRGTTARSAAAYRDLFTSPVNRHLSQGSISFYEDLQETGVQLELLRIGYLWLLIEPQVARFAPALETMAQAGVVFETLDPQALAHRLPDLQITDIRRGILGHRCGILNPHRLAAFYEQGVTRLGGRFHFGAEVSGFTLDHQGLIRGVKLGSKEILAGQVIVATGPWLGATMALAGLTVPVVPVKRQLFAIPAPNGPLRQLLHTAGFNGHDLLPFTILPGGAYLRPAPAAQSFLIGFANQDQTPGLEDRPVADRGFFEERLRPQLEQFFPGFRGVAPSHTWAGHYEDHPPDKIAFADRVAGALVVGGASGSGIMKADSLGRAAAGLFYGHEQVELGDGKSLQVAEIGLRERTLPPEEFVI
jgi:glycine/D-amino acid oxidase-like deaminating enzyme